MGYNVPSAHNATQEGTPIEVPPCADDPARVGQDLPRGSQLVLQVNGGDDPGDVTHNACSVSAAGQIFSEVDVSGAKPMNGAVAESDLRLA